MNLPIELSVVIIYRGEDEYKLRRTINSLPSGIELVLVETIQDASIMNVNLYNNKLIFDMQMPGGCWLKHAKYFYNEWSFSEARNYAKQFATRAWIYSCDADEEIQLNTNDFMEIVKSPADVLGIGTILGSPIPNDDYGYDLDLTCQIKIFRNDPRVKFKFRVHELVNPSIIEAGGKVKNMDIWIKHFGYGLENPASYISKLEFYVSLLEKDLIDYPGDPHITKHLEQHRAGIEKRRAMCEPMSDLDLMIQDAIKGININAIS